MADPAVQHMLEQLAGVDNVNPLWQELDQWAAQGEVGRLQELGHALIARPSDGAWQYSSVLDRVERLLALTPGADPARAAIRLMSDDTVPPGRIRRMAELLAQGQPPDVVLPLLADASTELGACLLQEMVLRGADVGAVASTWSARLTEAGHPLAGLPLTALPGEGRLPIREHGLNVSRSAGLPFNEPEPASSPQGRALPARRVTTPEHSRDLTAAVRTWLERSNGKAEAEVFAVADPISADDVGTAMLAGLPLECVAGPISLRRAGLDEIVALLFGAAANGGAYESGHGGAYGRLATWTSMGALTGAVPGTPVAPVATGRTWWTLGPTTPWFYAVAWDLGIVALDSDTRTLTVLAATDTD